MRKKSEFRQHHYWNCKKKYEREREKKKSDVMEEGEKIEFQ